MSQFLIFLTDGSEEHCCLITSREENAFKQLETLKKVIKRDNSWLELREYENATTNEYIVRNV